MWVESCQHFAGAAAGGRSESAFPRSFGHGATRAVDRLGDADQMFALNLNKPLLTKRTVKIRTEK